MASIRERRRTGGETVWAVLYRVGKEPDVRQKSQTFTELKKAERFRDLLKVLTPEKALAEIKGEGPKGVTVDEMAAQYFDWKARDVTPRTLADYRRDYDNWIRKRLGYRVAEDVDESDVQSYVDWMARTLSPKSVADRHMLLHSIFKFGKAKSRGLVTHNPCLETEMPKRTKKPVKGTTVMEWRAILRTAKTANPGAHDLVLFMGSLGWRWSEAAALAVRDVEDDGEHVWVDVTRVFRLFDNRQILVEDAAKTFAGFRRSRVPSEAAAMFRSRIIGRSPNDYVFTNSRGNHWNQNTFLRDTWPNILKAAQVGGPGRKPTPHWLRHMAVANMAKAGVPMHEIQRIIGHDDLATTNSTYGGMVTTLSSASITALDAVLAGKDAGGAVVSGGVVVPQALSSAQGTLLSSSARSLDVSPT